MPSTLSVGPSTLLRAWFVIGLQSFGGGSSVLSLIQRTFVRQQGWLTNEELVTINAISQMAPGINILAITIQIGDRLGGVVGIAASLIGLLLPSCAVTIAMTAGFASIEHIRAVQGAVRGIMPATIGIGTLSSGSMALALLRESRITGGAVETAGALAVLAGSAAALWLHAPVIAILCAGGAVMAVLRSVTSGRRTAPAASIAAEAESAAMDAEEAKEAR